MDEKIFLVISNNSANNILAQLHTLQSVISIFIYSTNNYQCDIDFNRSSKKIKIFNDQNSLIEFTRIYVRHMSKGTTTFGIFNNDRQNFIRDLTHQSASFLWFHIFIDVLKELPQAGQAKQQMIDTCINYYQTNHIMLNKIKKIEDTYQSIDAIRWYTENSFIYNLLNKALRTEDVQLLYLF
ncbi:unnamed protein product [Rotaria sp. Silwood1]|nr:unnamed protein product [Rotaria sp. Silwood1]